MPPAPALTPLVNINNETRCSLLITLSRGNNRIIECRFGKELLRNVKNLTTRQIQLYRVALNISLRVLTAVQALGTWASHRSGIN